MTGGPEVLVGLFGGSSLNHLVQAWGYAAVFALVAAESLGVPLPGETILVVAGIYAGSTHKLSIAAVWVTAAGAGILGSFIGYAIGRVGGRALLKRYGKALRLTDSRIKLGRYLFARHGAIVVFLGRFVSILRSYAAILAGANLMPPHSFSLANIAGGLAWAAVWAFGSYALGSTARAGHVGLIISAVLGGLIVVGALSATVMIRRRHRELIAKAEAAFPGPVWD